MLLAATSPCDVRIESHPTGGLTAQQAQPLIDLIRDLYLWFSPQSSDDDMYRRLTAHPNACTDLAIDHSGTCVAFSVHSTERFKDHTVMFRGGSVVKDRSRGLYKRLLENGVCAKKPSILCAMTQNPRVYESLQSFSPSGTVYPGVSGAKIPLEIQELAHKFCKAREHLQPENLMVTSVYDDIRKDADFRTARCPEVQGLFDLLGPDDGYFVIVPLTQ